MGLASVGVAPALAAKTEIMVYKSPTCGCCGAWVAHLQNNGYAVTVREMDDVSPIKAKFGVPANLQSCHTATVAGYVIEGHVPAADIARLLVTRPPRVRGLAVPGMPAGSPGMESGGAPDRYSVIAWKDDGTWAVYGRY